MTALSSLPDPYAHLPRVPTFPVTSRTVADGGTLGPDQFSGAFGVPGGRDVSPQLSWTGFPTETRSFVVTVYDPDAPTGSGFWHWVVGDIPATVTSLELDAGSEDGALLPAGARTFANDAGARRFIGAAPPEGSGTHHYIVTVTALDVETAPADPSASPALLGFLIGAHTIARGTLVALAQG